jgi:5'-nucleotidase/UDP-sugar diphosphatase
VQRNKRDDHEDLVLDAIGIMKAFFTLSLFVATSGFAYTKGETYKITVLHTNDHHGAFWKNGDDEYGMAARATLIKKLRGEIESAGGYVLLLDGGDVNTGTPESEMADAEPDFLGMSQMGYDAMAVGNHEFDKPFDVLLKQRKEWAKFPMLSANIYDKKTKKRFFEASKLFKFKDLKIALFGLTTEQTPMQSIRFPKDRLDLRNPVAEAAKLVPELRNKADVVFAVTHMGHYPNEQHGSRAPGDVTLARKVDGIDLIIGGHTQLPLFTADYENGTYIVQAGEWGKHLGRVDLEFKDGVLQMKKYELIPVNLKASLTKANKIGEDDAMLKLLKPFRDRALEETGKVVGKAVGKFEGHRSVIRKQETNLGNFVTFLMAKSTDADIAITDSGVIRNSLESGEVRYGDILSVHPMAFALKFATVELTGAELREYLKKVSVLTDGSYPQFYGIKVRLKGADLVDVQIKEKASGSFRPLESGKRYRLAITDFIASGGDSYPELSKHKTYQESELTDAAVMRKYFEVHKEVKASDFAPIGNLIKES